MRYLCLLFICFVIVSCRKKECDPGYLDAAEKAWIMYGGGQQVIFFSSSLQQHDTAVASDPIFEFGAGGYSQGQDDCGPHGTQYGEQSLTFHSGNRPMNLYVDHDYNRLGTSAILNNCLIPEETSGSMYINGHNYNDVRIIEMDSSVCADQYVWRYYLNQEFGILKFDRKNGPSWELEW